MTAFKDVSNTDERKEWRQTVDTADRHCTYPWLFHRWSGIIFVFGIWSVSYTVYHTVCIILWLENITCGLWLTLYDASFLTDFFLFTDV